MIKPILENRLAEVENLLSNVDEVCLAIAYVRSSGVRMLRPTYLQTKASFKILVDTKQRFTEKKALQQLLSDNFSMKRFAGNKIYHPKVWLFRRGMDWRVIVGSMNLSSVALNSNIEACVLLDGPEVDHFKQWFDKLWSDNNLTCNLDASSINTLPGASNIPDFEQLPEDLQIDTSRVVQSSYNLSDILGFIKAWSHDQASESPGPSLRKSGWVFRPAHGEIDQAKLDELQRILKAMFSTSSTSFRLTEASASQVLRQAGIIYQRTSHLTSDRARLIRQQINYLEKLSLIEKQQGDRTWDAVQLTALGRAYINSSSNQLRDFAESAIMRHQWFGVHIYDFTKAALLLSPESRIHYKEFFLFLRHGGVASYSFHTPEHIAKLIIGYRKLSSKEQDTVWMQMERWVNANDTSRSKTSLANMKENWGPGVFKDLAICKDFVIQNDCLCLVA